MTSFFIIYWENFQKRRTFHIKIARLLKIEFNTTILKYVEICLYSHVCYLDRKKGLLLLSHSTHEIYYKEKEIFWLKHISCKSQYKLYVRIIDILLHFSKVLTYFFCRNLCKTQSWAMSISDSLFHQIAISYIIFVQINRFLVNSLL